jgi:site-specific DNA-methyltransferase (adenine-specific)
MSVQFYKTSDIQIRENRQRREFKMDSLNELAESIEHSKVGLMHPLVVEETPDGVFLVAGERRLRAIQNIYELGGSFTYGGVPVPPDRVPATRLSDLSPVERMEAELDENVRRVDLTWQEKTKALNALAELKCVKAEAEGEAPPSNADLAEVILESRDPEPQAVMKQSRIVAQHLDNPEVQKAGSLKEAYKILRKQEEKKRMEKLSEEVGTRITTSAHRLFKDDSKRFLQAAPAEHFDVILTDPPYGMGADTFGNSGGATEAEHPYEDSAEVVEDIMEWFPEVAYRVAKANAHLYLFCDIDHFPTWKKSLAEAGWRVFRTPLIWYKPSGFRAPWPEKGPQRRYETILYAMKGDRLVNFMGGDVLEFPMDSDVKYNAQKPVALYHELLRRSAAPGDKVLDPFCGSGTIFPAATAAKVYAVGIEVMDFAHGIAASRLSDEP